MCGIIGYVGKDNEAIRKTISCLEKLEYRGYDSAGIAYVSNNEIIINKAKGRIKNLKDTLNMDIESNLAIAHTRWATHGDANDVNAHPHHVGKVTIVHNGIIENYLELKQELTDKGYTFKSDTDTEVACATIDYLYQENDILTTIDKLKDKLKGSYALAIIFEDSKDTIYAIRKDSPLILGLCNNAYFVASDVPAILEYTNRYIILDDNEIVKINSNGYEIYNNLKTIKKDVQLFDFDYQVQDKGNFEHFMLKEINEQPDIIYNLLNKHLKNDLKDIPDLTNYDRIDIVGCGSAYHTGLIGKALFEEYADKEVNCYIASEYRYNKNFFGKKSIVILISQSGETADTLACLRKVKENGVETLAIVNAVGSSIAREADKVIYINAGQEVAVATTKAYTAQVTILSLLALKVAYNKKMITDLLVFKKEANDIKDTIHELLDNNNYEEIASHIYDKHDIFFIGRMIDYAIALEGSLKLKEISYINSSTYPAGELKHGTISLVETGTPVVSIVTSNEIKDKTISNIKEVIARGAYSVVVTDMNIDSDIINDLIKIPAINSFFKPIISIIPLQLLAYYVAKCNGCDIDKPRNLAKSVTVE